MSASKVWSLPKTFPVKSYDQFGIIQPALFKSRIMPEYFYN